MHIHFAHFLIFAHSYHYDDGSQSVKEFSGKERQLYSNYIKKDTSEFIYKY